MLHDGCEPASVPLPTLPHPFVIVLQLLNHVHLLVVPLPSVILVVKLHLELLFHQMVMSLQPKQIRRQEGKKYKDRLRWFYGIDVRVDPFDVLLHEEVIAPLFEFPAAILILYFADAKQVEQLPKGFSFRPLCQFLRPGLTLCRPHLLLPREIPPPLPDRHREFWLLRRGVKRLAPPLSLWKQLPFEETYCELL